MKQRFTILLAILALTATSVIGQQRATTTGHTATKDENDYVYLFGGQKNDSGELSDEFWWWSPLINETVDLSVFSGPCARKNHTAYYTDGLLFIAGGVDADGNCLSDLWFFDTKANPMHWHLVNYSQPCASKATVTVVRDTCAVVVGGRGASGASLDSTHVLIITDTNGVAVAEINIPEPLQGSASFAKGGTVNIFGGVWDDWDTLSPGPQPSFSLNIWKFTPGNKSGSWSGVTATGTIKELTDMAYTQDTLENFFYVFGGKSYDYGTSTEIFSNEIFKLDLNTNVWSKLTTTLPVALAEFTATYIHGSSKSGSDTIYLLGGITAAGTISEYLYKFNVTTNTITTVSVAASVDDISVANENITLFPNPVSDVLTIKMSEKEQITKIEIINSLGKIVQSINNPTSREINLSQQNSGLYFIRVDTKTNRYFNKLIKQ